MKKLLSAIIMIVFTISIMTINVYAESDYGILNVEGVYHYDKAQEMLTLVNEERTSLGKSTLTLDKELTDAAMIRAAECAVLFEHARPDGTSCITASSKIAGENIAAGNSTASATFDQWKNSSGHYSNMIANGYNSIGIGCFSIGSLYYWVQDFGNTTNIIVETRTGETETIESIYTMNASDGMGFNLNMIKNDDGSRTLLVGESFELETGRLNSGWEMVYCSITSDTFDWSSSNPSIAKVDNKGVVTALKAGDVTITAKIKNGNGSVSQVIKCRKNMAADTITFSEIPDYTYSGKPNYPVPTVYDNGVKLVENVDYKISYSDDVINAKQCYVRITGIGDYSGDNFAYFWVRKLDISNSAELELFVDKPVGDMKGSDFVKENVNIYYNGEKLTYNKDYYCYSTSVNPDTNMLDSFGISFYGNYSGSKYMISLANAYVPDIKTHYYQNKAVIPDFKVYESVYRYYYNYEALSHGKDYNYIITNNNKPGTATITINGMGDYFGSLEKTFEIKSIELGDVDRNGSINMKDYALLQQYMNGWSVSIDTYAADMNSDNKINMKDYALLQQKLNGWMV